MIEVVFVMILLLILASAASGGLYWLHKNNTKVSKVEPLPPVPEGVVLNETFFSDVPAAVYAPGATLDNTWTEKTMMTTGANNRDSLKIIADPVAVTMGKGGVAGKTWKCSLGDTVFNVTLENSLNLDLADSTKVKGIRSDLEKIPVTYRLMLAISSEAGKDGVAYYPESQMKGALVDLTSGALNLSAALNGKPDIRVYCGAAGGVFGQRVMVSEPTVMEYWVKAIEKDVIKVRENAGGTSNAQQDLEEFAKFYGASIGNSSHMALLQKMSPARFKLWQFILSKA